MKARYPELAQYIRDHAIRLGDFTLVSGQKSSYYCDGKLVTFAPRGAALVADAILRETSASKPDAIGGLDMGATPIVAAVAVRSDAAGRPLPGFVVRKQEKAHGTKKRIEGPLPPPPARLVIVDDVITTGGSMIEAINVVRELGHQVILAISVLDREQGGREALERLGVTYQPLVTISELGIVPAAGS